MYRRPLPPQEYLRECFTYDPVTGKLFWKDRPSSHFHGGARQTAEHTRNACNKQFAGREAFTATSPSGYATGGINRVIYRAHRVIWKLVHGKEPDDVDHINGDRRDNRLCNLRSVTRQENMQNSALRRDNTSGVTGVRFEQRRRKWVATIKTAGGVRWLGAHETREAAAAARHEAERKYGFHENHGRQCGAPCSAELM